MKANQNYGITLIALVITIIVLLIISGVSLNAIIGENGVLERVQEAVMLTQLSELLFDLENDLFDVKSNDFRKKYNTTETYLLLKDNCTVNDVPKYKLDIKSFRQLAFSFTNSPIKDLVLNCNGDVFINNYKRGQIQISDVYQQSKISTSLYNSYFGDVDVKINDGSYSLAQSNYGTFYLGNYQYNQGYAGVPFLYTKYMNESAPAVPWVNSCNEVISLSKNFAWYPIGINTSQNLATIEPSDYSFELLAGLNDRDVLFPSSTLKIQNNYVFLESTLSYYLVDTYETYKVPVEIMGSTYYANATINFGGVSIYKAGVILLEKYDMPAEEFYDYVDEMIEKGAGLGLNCIARAVNLETGSTTASYHGVMTTDNLKPFLLEILDGRKPSRIYYVPFVYYYEFDNNPDTLYNMDAIYPFVSSTVKSFEVKW